MRHWRRPFAVRPKWASPRSGARPPSAAKSDTPAREPSLGNTLWPFSKRSGITEAEAPESMAT
eukprot:12852626-Alexandrium_andersonii.AAC.1